MGKKFSFHQLQLRDFSPEIDGLKRTEVPDAWIAKCPCHDGANVDLYLTVMLDDDVIVNCDKSCTDQEIWAVLEARTNASTQLEPDDAGSSSVNEDVDPRGHTAVNSRIERRPIKSLTIHPLSVKLFPDLPVGQFSELLEDIRANGIMMPPDITEGNEVFGGSQRMRAARELGWKTIQCRIWNDLDENQIRERLVADNLHRRQLSKLQVARCYRAMREIRGGKGKDGQGDVRDEIGSSLGISG